MSIKLKKQMSSRVNVLVFSLLLVSVSVSAQDVITLRNGDQIKVKVVEITTVEVKYKRFDHLDGPNRTLLLADVFSIDYENGMREIIKQTIQTQPTNKANRTQATSEPYKRQTTATSQGTALGVNVLTGFVFRNGFVDGGLGAKVLYTFPVPIRLAGEFDILWCRKNFLATRWIDFGVYGQYLLGKGSVITYPVIGFGFINFKATSNVVLMSTIKSNNHFVVTLGWGVGGHFKNSKLFYSIEPRFKIVRDDFGDYGYRVHLAVGIGYKF